MKSKIKELGFIDKLGKKAQSNIVYSPEGLAPTICAGIGQKYWIHIMKINQLGQMDNTIDHTFECANRVYGTDGLSPTITTNRGSDHVPKVLVGGQIVAMRGRGENNEQTLEIRGDMANTLTSVEKDNLLMEISAPEELDKWIWEIDGKKYLIRIRKLTPRECWRLMSFSDEDFDKAAEVNSNAQLYKQAGNSIVKDVLADIFSQMIGDQ